MKTIKETRLVLTLFAAMLLAFAPVAATAQQAQDAGATDAEIRIGNIMPYTGPLAAFAAIGRAEAAYFDMVNDRGGINGRKIRFISRDDSSNPKMAVELTRQLVEKENVLLMFGSFGTPGNLATRTYLNEKKIPQLFVASGDEEWAHPKRFPWTMGWQPTFRAEGRIYANYIQASYPDRKIAVLWQNDQFGRDLFRGLQEGLGDSPPHDRRRHRDRSGHVDRYPGRHPQEVRRRSAGAQLRAADLGARHPARGRTGLASGVGAGQCGSFDRQRVETRGASECRRRDLDLVPQGCRRYHLEGRPCHQGRGWRSWTNIIPMATRKTATRSSAMRRPRRWFRC